MNSQLLNELRKIFYIDRVYQTSVPIEKNIKKKNVSALYNRFGQSTPFIRPLQVVEMIY